jgi:SAM-dependent methyltransferase
MRKQEAVVFTNNLERHLELITSVFDISRIVRTPQAKQQIIRYYLTNRLTYRLIYNWQGFIHTGISYDGKHRKEDVKKHARMIERCICDTNAKNVLEIGSGLGPNSALLAQRNPRVTFDAIDLSSKPLIRYAKLPNLRFYRGDYHDLSAFEDDAYDIVFAIETMCYSTDKARVFREVKKKLRRGGIFFVVDYYQRDRTTPLSESEDIMWKLITRGVASEPFQRKNVVENYMIKEFSIATAKDLSPFTLPTLDRLESLACFYFNHTLFARVASRFLPFDIMKNIIVVFLLPTSVRRDILCYYLHVLRKDE